MRYLIVEKEKGLFLGSFNNVTLFAKENVFPIIKAPSFDSEEIALTYIQYYFANDGEYGVISVESSDKYVHIFDIIKGGYGEYTHKLIDHLPMLSEAVH